MDLTRSLSRSMDQFLSFFDLHKHRLAIKVLTGITLFSIITGGILYKSSIDECGADRLLVRQDASFRSLSSILFYTTLSMLFLFAAQIAVFDPSARTSIPSRKSKSRSLRVGLNWKTAFNVAFTILWFSMTYCLCVVAKTVLADRQCADHPNSISGHFAFHIYYLFALPYLYLGAVAQGGAGPGAVKGAFDAAASPARHRTPQGRSNAPRLTTAQARASLGVSTVLLVGTYGLFAATALWTLARTWVYGFHTPRQILYGTLLAMLSHWAKVELLSVGLARKDGPLALLALVTVAWAASALLVARYAAFPLETYEVVFCAALWILAAVYSWRTLKEKLE